jgi:hypothetical protein
MTPNSKSQQPHTYVYEIDIQIFCEVRLGLRAAYLGRSTFIVPRLGETAVQQLQGSLTKTRCPGCAALLTVRSLSTGSLVRDTSRS